MTTKTKEHPILFNPEMVRAVLAGRKTQTRRVIKPQPCEYAGGCHPKNKKKHDAPYIDATRVSSRRTAGNPDGMGVEWFWWTEDDRMGPKVGKCPYGQPGDRLWVREKHSFTDPHAQCFCNTGIVRRIGPDLTKWQDLAVVYFTDAQKLGWDDRWYPSIHMPRWASRITLEITDVRVERVKEISEGDAIAEGIDNNFDDKTADKFAIPGVLSRFEHLWNSINQERSFGWDANPWVWVVEFKVLEGNT